MKPLKQDDFAERLKTAAAAKKALLEKMKSAPKADDPEVMARRAEKAAQAAAKAAATHPALTNRQSRQNPRRRT